MKKIKALGMKKEYENWKENIINPKTFTIGARVKVKFIPDHLEELRHLERKEGIITHIREHALGTLLTVKVGDEIFNLYSDRFELKK